MGRRGDRWGRRCDIGCTSWPDDDKYDICPICKEETERFSNLQPIEEDEAASLVNHLEFEEYYQDRCDRRGLPAEGDLEPTEEQHEKYDALYPGGQPDGPKPPGS
jgi:hypothetical protein